MKIDKMEMCYDKLQHLALAARKSNLLEYCLTAQALELAMKSRSSCCVMHYSRKI